jgi:rifampicin phosphotransferase
VGLHTAMAELRAPFAGFSGRTELGWAYEGQMEPDWQPDPAVMRQAARNVQTSWTQEIQPRVHAITATLNDLRPDVGSPSQAVEMLDQMWELVVELWTLHFRVVVPAQFAIEEFSDRYTERFGDRDPLAPYRILAVTPTESFLADQHLQSLAQAARALRVADIIVEFPTERVWDRLSQRHNGRTFLQGMSDYLLRYGGRSRWHELSLAREVEDPKMTFQALRLLLQRPDGPITEPPGPSPADTRLLDGAPELGDVLQAARDGYDLKESHVYHIDYPGLLATREVLLSFGRRLVAAGFLADLEDVWLLTRMELRDLLAEQATDPDMVQQLLGRRRDDLAAGAREGVRSHLGDPPETSEQHGVLQKFYGMPASADSNDLAGAAASPGVAEGVACLVRDPDDFDRVTPGAILVSVTTTPAWTPLFGVVGGLVTDTGGVLCHAAIVAREYGIPAVVGVDQATRLIPDGARVRVDGDAGTVELL